MSDLWKNNKAGIWRTTCYCSAIFIKCGTEEANNLCVCVKFVFTLPCLFSFSHIYNPAFSGCFALRGELNLAIICATNNSVLEYLLAIKSQSNNYADAIIIWKATYILGFVFSSLCWVRVVCYKCSRSKKKRFLFPSYEKYSF